MSVLSLVRKIGRKICKKSVWEIIVFFLIALVFVHVFSAFIPYHFDEFSQYHALGCLYYPNNMLNTFRASCPAWQLAPFGNYFMQLRSGAPYMGSPSCLIYFPLFLLWPAPISARLMGLLWLGVQAACLKKLFRVDFLLSFIFLLGFMPYTYMHVFDSGAIHWQTTSVFFIYCLLQRWMEALKNLSGHAWRYPVAIGFIIFWGIWTKLTYFAVIPGIACLIVYYCIKKREVLRQPGARKKLVAHVVLMVAVASSLIFVLLHSKTIRGDTYYQQIIAPQKASVTGNVQAVKDRVAELGKYFTNPLQAAHFNYRITKSVTPTGLLFSAVLSFILVFGTIRLFVNKREGRDVLINIALCILTFFILVVFFKRAGSMHHLVLCFPFMLIALFHIGKFLYKSKVMLVAIICFFMINAKLYLDLGDLSPKFFNPLTKIKYLDVINKEFPDGYVYIVQAYGIYFIKALYGPKDQCVLYWNERIDEADQIERIKAILSRLNRKALFIVFRNADSFSKYFPGLVEQRFDFNTNGLSVWYQP